MQTAVDRFVEFFWAGADQSLKDYVRECVSSGVSGNDSAMEAAELLDFLPQERNDPGAMLMAFSQLKALVADPSAAPSNFEWNATAENLPGTVNPTVAPPPGFPPLAAPAAATSKRPPAATVVFSELKPSAASFQPGGASTSGPLSQPTAAALTGDVGALSLRERERAPGATGTGEYEGWEDGNAYSGNAGNKDGYHPSNAATVGGWEGGQQLVAVDPASEGAFMSVLQQQFPEYSPAALWEMFDQYGRSLSATVDALYRLENELQGAYAATWAATSTKSVAAAAPEFSNDDFPTLGGGTAAAKHAVVAPASGVANYAGKAKAAARLPPPPTPSADATSTNYRSSAPFGGGAAPVWTAQGVRKFSTGAEVAAEYADVREEARDHARLRNACFQNATQAYLAGNKALAKELGAKGRWHNEQMKAAHAVAATDTFSRRNAAALDGRSGGGPPTIDLHGLHVSEAIQHLEDALWRLTEQGIKVVRVVVGVGQHGKVRARLPGAVREALDEWGLPYKDAYEGLLEVKLA